MASNIWRILKLKLFIKRETMRKYLALTAHHEKGRTDFIRIHMRWNSKYIEVILLFSQVHVPFKYKLHFVQVIFKFEKGAKVFFPTRNFGGGSLMVWAAFSSFDNAAIHVSCSTKDWFQSRNIVFMNCASRSPDLNVMENL
uniref:Transposable element Tc1 transposase n=1 Tax=Heterorhabditis bacteriophora TaxID=37862 RepID=A0A1I7XBD7_HETBA